MGQSATIGRLYDARRDAFLPEPLIKGDVPEDVVTSVSLDQTKTLVCNSDSLKEKFEKLGMNSGLTASFLAGMVEAQGSAKYLTQKRDTLPTVHRALHHVVMTKQETLNFSHPSLKALMDFPTPLQALPLMPSRESPGEEGRS